MSGMDLFEQIAALRREGRLFALATVVARRPPVSALLGHRAIVYEDGRMEGFVGGACSHEIIRKQALEALKVRQPRLVSIRPDRRDELPTPEHVTVPMTCASEGAIDVYVEPFVESRRLVVVGATPVARALARIARAMDYDVVRAVETAELRDIEPECTSLGITAVGVDALPELMAGARSRGIEQAAVVASQGHYDEQALELILKSAGTMYVGLVASRRRAATMMTMLEENGVPGTGTIHNPAGLDLNARTPPDVALSILAQVVKAGSGERAVADSVARDPATAPAPPPEPEHAIDPVCGMSVNVATARHSAEVGGAVYYFCCASCRSRFLQNPQPYVAHP